MPAGLRVKVMRGIEVETADGSAPGESTSPLSFASANRARFVERLKELVRFRTVSAQPGRKSDIEACSRWLATQLHDAGLKRARVIPTSGYPVVYAEWRGASGRPTVLIYGHYDVQPVDPLGEWQSPPFEPAIRGDDLYGRGASDDKGQLLAHVNALESYLSTIGELPLNVVCIFEGEEEVGSPNLASFLARHRKLLAADVAVISDMPMAGPHRPAITHALRGALSVELELSGPNRDLHSGLYGGAVHNPMQALCETIGRLHDAERRVAIDGFYVRVRRWSPRERAYMARAGPGDAEVLRNAGVERGFGEPGYTPYERTTIRPSLTVTGVVGGYQGPGVKAVIPARVSAKLDFRLVPDQDPEEISRLFRRHISTTTPPTIRAKIRTHFSAKPVLTDVRHPGVRAAVVACRKGFGTSPVMLRVGGTIPAVGMLQEVLGLPSVLMGFGLPDDRQHAPNEKFHLPNYFRATETSLYFMHLFGTRGLRAEEGIPLEPAGRGGPFREPAIALDLQ